MLYDVLCMVLVLIMGSYQFIPTDLGLYKNINDGWYHIVSHCHVSIDFKNTLHLLILAFKHAQVSTKVGYDELLK